MRDHLLINHDDFPLPLGKGLERCGLTLVHDQWEPAAELLDRSQACFIWFYECLRHPLKVWRLKRRLARHGVPLVAWNRDAPHYLNRRPWRLDLLNKFRLLDIYATHTLADTKRKFADLVLYLPNGADTDRYWPDEDPATRLVQLRNAAGYRWDVSFFGGMDGDRYKEMRSRQIFFTALAARLDAKGISHCFREAGGMSLEQQIAFIQSSRINLNFGASCEYGDAVASGLPERCYGIPACGGFLLCDKRTHAADDFSLGENWAEFEGLDDCVEKIEYWLTHFDSARSLAERSYHHVAACHSYGHRAVKLHQALLAWHAGRRGVMR